MPETKAENERMAELYRRAVLKASKPEIGSGLQIQGLGKKNQDIVTTAACG